MMTWKNDDSPLDATAGRLLAAVSVAVLGALAGGVAAIVSRARRKRAHSPLDDFEELPPAVDTHDSASETGDDSSTADPAGQGDVALDGVAGDGSRLPDPPEPPVTQSLPLGDYDPVCFSCGEPMRVEKPFKTRNGVERWDCNVSDGLEFTTVGEYGSAYWDEDGLGSRLSAIICDDCMRAHEDRLHVRPAGGPGNQWPKPMTMAEYAAESGRLPAGWSEGDLTESSGPSPIVDLSDEAAGSDADGENQPDDGQEHAGAGSVEPSLTWNDEVTKPDSGVRDDADTADSEDVPVRGHHPFDGRARLFDGLGLSLLLAYGLRPEDEVPDDLLLPGGLMWMRNDPRLDEIGQRFESTIEFYSRLLVERNRECNELRRKAGNDGRGDSPTPVERK